VTSRRTIGEGASGQMSVRACLPVWRMIVGAVLLQSSLLLVFSLPASAKPGYSVHPPASWRTFSLNGSRGYDIVVVEEGKTVRIEAFDSGGRLAAYQTQVHKDGNMIRAKIGSVGRIAMRFVPSTPYRRTSEPQGDCRGKRSLVQRGTFRGTFQFQGELGFTSARVTRAPGMAVREFREICRGASAALGPDRPVRPALRISHRSRSEEVKVLVYRSRSVDGIEAGLISSQPHLVTERWCWNFGEEVQIDKDAVGNMTIEAGLPFEGRAMFQPMAESEAQWSGDLRCSLPGRGIVPLVGPGFRTE